MNLQLRLKLIEGLLKVTLYILKTKPEYL